MSEQNTLKNYMGTNSIPNDFDEYWDNAVDKMKAVDPQITITEAEFKRPGAKCYDLHFTGINGARIYAKFLRPEKVKDKIPAVLLFHGYADNSGNWFEKLGYIDVKNLAPRVKADTIIFTGLSDTVCPPQTQYAVYNNLKCKKRHIIYPEFGHESLSGATDIMIQYFNEGI